MRNHSKGGGDKEKTKKDKNDTQRSSTSKTQSMKKLCANPSSQMKKLNKDKSINDDATMECVVDTAITSISHPECIYLDVGSKKSYIDLTDSKAAVVEPYPRISVIRTVGLQSKPTHQQQQLKQTVDFQEKPVDFSPKHKFKSEFNKTSNLNEISRQYATMVV